MEGLVVTKPRAHPYGFVIQKRMIYIYCPPDMAGKFSFHASSVNQVKIAQATNIAWNNRVGRLSDTIMWQLYILLTHRQQTIIANNLSVVETPFIRKNY